MMIAGEGVCLDVGDVMELFSQTLGKRLGRCHHYPKGKPFNIEN